jgi:hypothetical protein
MREIRIIAALAIAMMAFVVGALLWTVASAKTGPLDEQAARRIDRLCGFEVQCKVRLADLFEGNWDTFYEFGVGVDQSTMDDVLGTHQVKRADRQRTLVLMKGTHVVAAEHETYGVQQPLAGQIEFIDEHHREQSWVKFSRDTRLRVSTFRAGDTKASYYVLIAQEP